MPVTVAPAGPRPSIGRAGRDRRCPSGRRRRSRPPAGRRGARPSRSVQRPREPGKEPAQGAASGTPLESGRPRRRLEVSRQTVYAIETGHYDPSLPLAFKIAALFGEPIESLFSPDDTN
ncbi:helix-turn-helix transcriptional regulator [Streptomyces virginiae]|nr:helix-turn-helix transcriptional regulator [Streptomyces virginiae]